VRSCGTDRGMDGGEGRRDGWREAKRTKVPKIVNNN
jgi:hypothetical protein